LQYSLRIRDKDQTEVVDFIENQIRVLENGQAP